MLRILCSILLFCGFLSGCSSPIIDTEQTLPQGVEDTSPESLLEIYENLSLQHVTVLSMGDKYMLSIPSYLLFYNGSPKLKPSSYEILDDVIAYLQSYRKISVKVTAFSEYCKSESRTRALTDSRAKVLGKYLWSQNIRTNMIFTAGVGHTKPITRPGKKCSDTSLNSRIEIVFRQVAA